MEELLKAMMDWFAEQDKILFWKVQHYKFVVVVVYPIERRVIEHF